MDRNLKIFVVILLAIIVFGNLIHGASHSKQGGEPPAKPVATSEPQPVPSPATVAPTTTATPALQRHPPTGSSPTTPSATEDTDAQPQSSPPTQQPTSTTAPQTPTYPYGYVPDNQASASDSGPPSPPIETNAQRVGRQLRGR